MNWFDPADDSEPVIKPRVQAKARYDNTRDVSLSKKLLMVETGGMIDYLLESRSGHIIQNEAKLPAFLEKRPLYTLAATNPISIVEGAYSAPVAVDVLETAIAYGAKQAFFFGICGGISKELSVGDVIIPDEILRMEGTSYHYKKAGVHAKPDQELVREFCRFLEENGQTYVRGKTVTTDGLYRQTLNLERHWQKEGILGVDMEMSALLTVSEYHHVPAMSVLVVSDVHQLEEGAMWKWGGVTRRASKKRILDLLLDYVISE